MEEMLDVYDLEGNLVGVRSKRFCHGENPGVYYKPVWVWIINSKGEILLQKRASTKKYFPNRWDHSVGGHVKSGEQSIKACVREVKEELGIKVDPEKFVFIGEFVEQIYWHIGQIYILNLDKDISQFKINKSELSEVKWFTLKEFKETLFSDEFGPFQDDYKKWAFNNIEKYVKKEKNKTI